VDEHGNQLPEQREDDQAEHAGGQAPPLGQELSGGAAVDISGVDRPGQRGRARRVLVGERHHLDLAG